MALTAGMIRALPVNGYCLGGCMKAGLTSSQMAAILTELKPRFLGGLTEVEGQAVLRAADRKQFSANSVITSEGDPATHLYLMLDNGVRFYTVSPQGRKLVVRWVPAGDLVGPVALVGEPVQYVLSTEAVKKSSALVWDLDTIRSLAAMYPRLMENALLVANDYVVLFKILHVVAHTRSAPQRLAQVLGYLGKEMGQKIPGGVELQIRNEELAQEANVTIFTVSRLMREWQLKGLLQKSRGKVLLRSPEKLIRLES
jgi:CRP-like cAMP-binding protein